MKTYQMSWLCCATLVLGSCGDLSTDSWPQKSEVIYANSFEAKTDTSGWRILADFQLVSDAPPGGGFRSVRVLGGCAIPHAMTLVQTNGRVGKFYLECYGKNLSRGGSVELYPIRQRDTRIAILVQDSTWVRYRSEEHVEAGMGDTLVIAINAGGIIPSAILVDCLCIYHAE